MTDEERIAELEKENQKLLESVEGATAMYIDLQDARKRIAELEAQIEKMKCLLSKAFAPMQVM